CASNGARRRIKRWSVSRLNETLSTFTTEIQSLTSPDQVREKRRELQGWVRKQFQELSALEPEEKRRVGQELNRVKTEMERLVVERLREWEGATRRREDDEFAPALPAPPLRLGRVHPTIVVLRQMNTFFRSLGFEVVEGPEIETDRYNYGALNIPA